MDDLWDFGNVLTTGDDSWEIMVEDQKRSSCPEIRLQGKAQGGMPSEVRCHFKQLGRGNPWLGKLACNSILVEKIHDDCTGLPSKNCVDNAGRIEKELTVHFFLLRHDTFTS
jgi:hypothetical protein